MPPIRSTRILAIVLAIVCATAASAFSQTIRTLGYNTTNGQIVYSGTNTLSFQNTVQFGLTVNFGSDISINSTTISGYNVTLNLEEAIFANSSGPWNFQNTGIYSVGAIEFDNTTNAATTRTNLGLPLNALTNDSNVKLMRALSGSTNTNEPYSGSVSLTNTNTLVFSNGVLLRIE